MTKAEQARSIRARNIEGENIARKVIDFAAKTANFQNHKRLNPYTIVVLGIFVRGPHDDRENNEVARTEKRTG
jgi:hypothetical protein